MVAAVGSFAAPPAAPGRHDSGHFGPAQKTAASGNSASGNSASANDERAQDGAPAGNRELTDAEQKQVRKLKKRDAEVRAHEQAHTAAGGVHAGSPSYTTERGPDGRTYAVEGEVSIDVSPAQTPRATIAKADQIVRAAMAPADPSPQDARVAASARQMRAEAQAELLRIQAEERNGGDDGGSNAAAGPQDTASRRSNGSDPATEDPASRQLGPDRVQAVEGTNTDAAFIAQRAYDEAARRVSAGVP